VGRRIVVSATEKNAENRGVHSDLPRHFGT